MEFVDPKIHVYKLCEKCKKNINTFEPTEKELKQLEKNLEVKTNEIIIEQINKMRAHNEELKKSQEETKKIINKLLKRYESSTKGKLENYVGEFAIEKSDELISDESFSLTVVLRFQPLTW